MPEYTITGDDNNGGISEDVDTLQEAYRLTEELKSKGYRGVAVYCEEEEITEEQLLAAVWNNKTSSTDA